MYGNLYWFVITSAIAIIASHFDIYFLFPYLMVIFFLYKRKKIKRYFLFLILFTSITTYVYYEYLQHVASSEIAPYIEMLHGEIQSEVTVNDQILSFQFQPSKNKPTILITYFPTEKDKLISMSDIKTGSKCVLKNLTAQNNYATNPGQFDYHQYLINSGIKNAYTIRNREDIACQSQGEISYIYEYKSIVINHIKKSYSLNASNWILALIFGNKDGLDDEIIALFQRWNLSHLLAISGLHVGLIIFMFYMIMLRLPFLTREKAQNVLFILLLVYPLISGGAPSVWRACLMAFLVLIQFKCKLAFSALDVLSIVYLVMLWVDPYSVYQLGFQFSFIVTFAILLSKNIVKEAVNYLHAILQISGISLLIILPIQLYHFYTFNPLAILINLLYIPYFSFILIPISLLMVLFSKVPVFPSLLEFVYTQVQSFSLFLLEKIDKSLYFPLLVGKFPLSIFVIYYALILGYFIYWDKKKKLRAYCMGIFVTILLIVISVSPYFNDNGTITVLDIGQGDAIIIELPYRKGVIMIDAAGTMDKNYTESSNKNFERIIKPFLLSKGISKIDALFLSHDDHDHIGSVPFLLDEFKVDKIFTTKYFDEAWIREYITKEEDIEYHHLKGGQVLTIKGQPIEVLFPVEDSLNKNDNSLVLRSKFGPYTWLFTGDVGEEAESDLLAIYPNLQSDILKVSHHGSATSSSEAFLVGIQPQIGLISVGANNRYNHPDDEVLKRFKARNIPILRTDQSGAIIYSYSKDKGTFLSFMHNIQDKKDKINEY